MAHPDRFISRLRLTGFRNHLSAALDLDARHVVLTGDNGTGKTNLLEALSLLSPGRGLKRAPFDELPITGGDGAWAVAVTLQTPDGPVDLGTGISAGGPAKPSGDPRQPRARRARINGAFAKTIDALGDYFRVLWITPDMDGLFTGPAQDRRRFFDRLVTALIPRHNTRLSTFEKSMRQRNRLLEENRDPAWLDAVETEMATHATAIHFARTDTLNHLQRLLAADHQTSPFPNAGVALAGLEPFEHQATLSTILEDDYRAAWHHNRKADAASRRTTIGPHRTDLNVRHLSKRIEARLCSTGEQKALLIGLVLGHAALVSEVSELPPALLLDEIAAHLDPARRAALFDRIDTIGSQCWMTGTDPVFFQALGTRAQRFVLGGENIMPAP
ncbi:MAG: DNA replication/repair protein RecF [Alphaproteobacteria bacterium]|nr:DNA replication/repair protein RecF [Alphaproteobacteria bacterium]